MPGPGETRLGWKPIRALEEPSLSKWRQRHEVNNVTPSTWAVMGALPQGCGSQRRLLLTLLVNGVWEKKQRQLVNIDFNPKENQRVLYC